MGRLERMLGKTWVLGALVAVASWNVIFARPVPGNDGSWVVGLYMAADRGLQFGQELIFTYGPLGFLSPLDPSAGGVAVVAVGGLSQIAFLYSAAMHVLLCVSLIWALRRGLPAGVAAALTFVLIAGFTAIERPYVLAAIWCLALLSEAPDPVVRRIVIFGGGGLAAIESLIRLSSGPAILVICVIAVAARPSRWRDLAALGGTYLGSLAVLWFAAGQGIGNIPDFVAGAFQIVSGYSQAMATSPTGTKWDLAVWAGVLAIVALAAGAFASTGGRRRGLCAALVVGVVAFAAFKEGVVREDEAHLSILFATALGLALAIPWRRRGWPAAIALVAFLGVMAIETASPPLEAANFDPVDHADTFGSQVGTLGSAARRERLADSGRSAVDVTTPIDEGTLALLRGRTVHVDPSGAAAVWAYGLDWRPLPIFQENSAYTSTLDRDNVDFLASADGPDRVLRGVPGAIDPFAPETIDGRNPSWNPPGVAVEMLCRFRSLRTTPAWQVLARGPQRCGPERAIGSVQTTYGQPVTVPAAGRGEMVIARIHGAAVSGFERLRTLLFRSRLRYATVNGDTTYRLVPGTAADGLIMSVPRTLDFPAPFSLSPGARTLELTGADGSLRIDFYAVPLRARGPDQSAGGQKIAKAPR